MHRKDGQIIAQVHRALEHVLRERAGTPLTVLGIDPMPDARRLLITLCPTSPGPVPEGDALVPALRWELARILSRKRLPELRVVVLPAAPVWKESTDA
ncbi:MAG: hypothetical protein GC200_10140 [Tepidisphaera sp.]|nr:hypothetical protein [Tepidisphaera sp.]